MEGEGKDIGRAPVAHVIEIEALHLGIAAQGQLDLGVIAAECDADRFADRRLEQVVGNWRNLVSEHPRSGRVAPMPGTSLDDVLLVNPTHVAVALKYDPEKGAPRVVAKGAGEVAAKLREIATEARVQLCRLPGERRHADRVLLAVGAEPQRVQELTQAWLQKQARQWFEQRLQHYLNLSGLSASKLRLAAPAKRWGSCNSDGTIMLNWRLIHFHPTIIDYVVAHEVAHLQEMNHGPRFWALVETLYPDFVNARNQLRQYDPGTLPLL